MRVCNRKWGPQSSEGAVARIYIRVSSLRKSDADGWEYIHSEKEAGIYVYVLELRRCVTRARPLLHVLFSQSQSARDGTFARPRQTPELRLYYTWICSRRDVIGWERDVYGLFAWNGERNQFGCESADSRRFLAIYCSLVLIQTHGERGWQIFTIGW